MAITNRDLDLTERRHNIVANFLSGTVTSATYAICVVPFPAMLVSAGEVNMGLSGSPNHSIAVWRFNVGAGLTNYVVGQSISVAGAFGLSGGQTYVCQGCTYIGGYTNAAGVTGAVGFTIIGATYALQTGDVLVLQTAGANTATAYTSVTCVLQALQDIRSEFGI